MILETTKTFRGKSTKCYCDNCGEEFYRCNSNLREHHFCCFKCYNEWRTGENNHRYKRGYSVGSTGYCYTFKDGKRTLLHRLIVEQDIGRKLNRWEYVHHINGNKTDNRLENLEVLNSKEHNHKHIIFNKQDFYNQCFIEYLNPN